MLSFVLSLNSLSQALSKSFFQTLTYFQQGNLNTACVGYNGSGITGKAVAEEPYDYGCQSRWPGEFPTFA